MLLKFISKTLKVKKCTFNYTSIMEEIMKTKRDILLLSF